MNSKNYSVTPRSSTAITATSTGTTTVYHGPDASVYAVAGTIGAETVNILATSMEWYHIEYNVNGTDSQRKTGYVPKSALTNVTGGTPSEEDFYGGYCFATQELAVRTCDVFANTAETGKLFKDEGCTFLFSYSVNGTGVAFIEYSTSAGTKRGYVESAYLKFTCETIVAIANENLNVYAGPNTAYTHFGTVFKNELVSVIALEENIAYIEYNTTKGRKRGYVDWTKLNPRDYDTSIIFNTFYSLPTNSACYIGNERVPVYAGPSTSYAEIGAVRAEEITCYWTNNSNYALTCIEYIVTASGLIKRGYIDPTKAIVGSLPLQNNELESFDDSYPHFGTKIVLAQKSQKNQDLFYYRAGTGAKHIYLVFAQHGWEDGLTSSNTLKAGDGNTLCKIAKEFMNKLATMNESDRNTILSNWSIFLFPQMNPDGIKYGNTNKGFGRCYLNKIDPNRSWPGNFKVNTAPGNFTGDSYLGAVEMQALYSILQELNKNSSEAILLDIHGWENSVIANDLTLQNYFLSEFRKLNSSCARKILSRSSGYLATWAENSKDLTATSTDTAGLGAKAALLEFPATTDYGSTTVSNYSEALFNGTINLLLSKSVTNPDEEADYNKGAYDCLLELYDLAKKWNDNSINILENNKLVLDYLRFLEYSLGGTVAFDDELPHNFDELKEEVKSTAMGSAMTWLTNYEDNTDFFKHVHSLGKTHLNPSKICVYVKSISRPMDLQHFAIPALTLLNNPDKYLKDFSGWAGDLSSLGGVLHEKYCADNSYAPTAAEIMSLIGCSDDATAQSLGFESAEKTKFELIDLYQDIDAVNMANSLKETEIFHVIYNYYQKGGDNNRKEDFINNVISSHSYSGDDAFQNVVKLYSMKHLDDIDSTYFTFFSVPFKYFDEKVWGERLTNAFVNKIQSLPSNPTGSDGSSGDSDNSGETETPETPVTPTVPQFDYGAYCQNLGWQEGKNNWEMAGLYGQGLRIEAVIMNAPINIQYRVHMAGIGWGPWVPNGCVAGTTGESRAIEAIEIISSSNTMVGQGYVENIGFQSEVTGTQIMIGTTGQGLRLEGFRLKFI